MLVRVGNVEDVVAGAMRVFDLAGTQGETGWSLVSIWLVAGALLLSYCIFRNDTLFTFVQVINITAIVATIVLALCPR